MNIGIVTTWFPRGAAYVSRAYLETFSARHNVFIYARGGERYAKGDREWDKKYVTWGKRPVIRSGTYINWRHFRKWVERNRLDLVLFNEQQDWEIVLKAIQLPIPVGSYVDYYTAKTLPFFRLYDFLFCNTRRHYSVFREHPQTFYIPWGTDVDIFKPPERTAPGNAVTFIHAAGISPMRKGTDLVVKAFQKVKGDAKLVIRIQTGKAFRRCFEIPDLIKGDSRIELIEKETANPRQIYSPGDVYVYPSRRDGLGLQVAEALACGLPVITTAAEPMADFVTDGLNGKLVKVAETQERPEEFYWPRAVCDLDSLKEAMQFFVDNPDRIREFQKQARMSAEEKFDWKKNSENLPEIVAKLERIGARSDAGLIKEVTEYETLNNRFLKRMDRIFRRFRKKFGYGL